MARALSIGDEAPNFDLTSTEDVVLMLRDECVRTAVILYFFRDTEGERVRDDLLALARRRDDLAATNTRVLGVSPADVEALKALQKELHLPFPLLADDRGFSAGYGVREPGEDGAQAEPVLAVVDRWQRLVALQPATGGVAAALPAAIVALAALPSPTASLPRKVVNWWIDRWVH
jgi:peroxiredoxin